MRRHGRACPGHPRLSSNGTKNVDARDKPGHDEEIFAALCRLPSASLVISAELHKILTEQAMTIFTDTAGSNASISTAARWTGRALSGVVILFLLLDGSMKLLPLQIVTETMDKMGYGASDNLARSLGLITIICTLLYAVPPTSILGALLLTGYLGGAIASHVRIDSPLFTHTLFGLYLGLMLWGGLWLRDGTLRSLLPFHR
jgi:DoxX-like family